MKASEESLSLLRPVQYHAPTGLFDEDASGKPAPQRLLEIDDGVERMANYRAVLALQTVQHIFLCGSCVAGQFLSEKMKMKCPGFVAPAALGAAGLTAFFLWGKQTRWPLNMLLAICFTALLGGYLAASILVGEEQPHVAHAIFQISFAVAMLFLYSLGSFCCDLSLFDVKYVGYYGYLLMLVVAAGGGLIGSQAKMGEIKFDHIAGVAVAAAWSFASFFATLDSLSKFREGHVTAIFIQTIVWPIDLLFVGFQSMRRGRLPTGK